MKQGQRRPVRTATSMLIASGCIAAAAIGGATGAGAAPAHRPVYLDPSHSPTERAADLVSRMTLAEKASEMNSSMAAAIPRLGVASWGWWNESNHGINATSTADGKNAVNVHDTTSYPSDLSLGSTWNPDLVYQEAGRIGDEARDTAPGNRENLDFYAPTVNLSRDPRWGRNDESWSEDPTLTASLAAQYVDGLQGQTQDGTLLPSSDGYYKALATLKHFAANNSEVNRRSGSSDMDQRTLREYYTAQFADIIEQADPGSIMSSYNEVNGVPTAASVQLTQELARETYGFSGYFTSDCDAVREIQAGHTWQPPGAPAPLDQYGRTAYANSSGEDLDCNTGYHDQYSYGNTIPTAIAQHIQTQTDTYNVGDVDTSVVRLFTARIETGEFDDENSVPWVRQARARLGGKPWVNDASNAAVTETSARLQQAQTSAEESLVLLKNTAAAKNGRSLLPLQVPSSGAYKIAVVGWYAHPQSLFLGGYSSIQDPGSGASNNVDAYTGIKDAVHKTNPNAQVDWLPGVLSSTTDPTKTNGATLTTVDADSIAKAKGYDAVVVVAGTDSSTGREDVDRADLALPGAQAAMISQVEAANPETVVYLETMGPVDTGSFAATTPSLLWSSYNGQRQGAALADVLLGKVNPSGHLPFTWYADESQLPSITDYAIRPTATTAGRTYQYFTGTPAWPFGSGGSYAQFSYGNLRVQHRSIDAEGTVTATADVTNTGTVTGAAVPQLYASTPFEPASAQRPVKRLEAYGKVTLRPGQTRQVTFSFPASKLAFFDEAAGKFSVDNGTYQLQLATSAADADVRQAAPVAVTGSLGSVPTHVTASPVQAGDRAADVAQRVVFDVGTAIDPQLTVSLDDQTLHGYVAKGQSSPLPRGLQVQYRSSQQRVVRVGHDGSLRTVGSGIATITATVRYRDHSVTTSFVVDVAPLQITSAPTASLTTGTAGTVAVTTATTQSPTPAEVPSLSVQGLPAGLTFTDRGDGTGTIAGTPGAAGTYQVVVRARNAVSPAVQQVLTLTVTKG